MLTGIPMEMVHKFRILVITMFGIIFGAMVSYTVSDAFCIGASGGVYLKFMRNI